MFKTFCRALCLLTFPTLVFSQNKLLTPNEFLPHKLGEQFTEHSLLVSYFQHVAANSDRVKLTEFGRTNQKRPQVFAVVSSPENLRRIEDIRLNNLRNAGLVSGQADNANPITFVWLGFSVHGNEAAGSEASMGALYELCNPANSQTQEWLRNTVVLIEPSVNPDGYSRYTSWYRQASPQLPNPNPSATEHDEPWPGGRVNHYLFDLNRDWAWATQTETQNRLKVYNDWLPHVAADLHEMGYRSPYYFAPAAQPYHTFLTKWQRDFQVDIGKNNAKYFDANGWLYFTKEVFDLFYPSYGDTYPCFNGAIGMTYEQGGHSRAGRAISLPNGDTLTLADRVAHHQTTALSTVEISSKNAASLVQNFADYFKKSQSEPPGQYKSFVIKATNPAPKIKALTSLLDRHGIRYGKAGKAMNGVNGYEYASVSPDGPDQSRGEGKFNISEADLIVSAYQPKGLLAQVLFEPTHELVDSMTYDITAWALPWAFGLDAFALKQRLDPASQGYDEATVAVPGGTPYAYLVPWNSMQSARFLADLLEKNIAVRYAEEPFEVEGKRWAAGTLVVTRADNRKNSGFDATLRAAASARNVEVTGARTGFVSAGLDFGSSGYNLIDKPSVLVLSGEKTFNNEFGQVWHYFDRDIGYGATILDAEQLGSVQLNDYNTLILPEGFYGFDDPTLGKIGEWVSSGGRLIAIGYANKALEDKPGFSLARYAKPSDKEEATKKMDDATLSERVAQYDHRVRSSISDGIPGAVVRVKMDPTHPLAFGLKNYYFSLKTSDLRYDLLKNAWNVGYLEDNYQTNGFIGSRLKANLKNSAVFAVQDKGRGKVIYLVDNPLFRGFWEEGKLLFSNAVFLAR